MTEDINKEIKELEELALNVLSDLLISDIEGIRLKAAKIYSSLNDEGLDELSLKELMRVKRELLGSEDEKVLLQAAEHILLKNKKNRLNHNAGIISPFEIWYKATYKNKRYRISTQNQERIIKYKYQWFKNAGYKPHPSQKKVHDSKKRFIVCISGRRFGKSLLAAKEAEAMLMQPGKRVWVVAPTYTLTEKIFREIYSSLIIKRMIKKDMVIKKSENERLIRLAWDSEVVGKSSDNPDSLLGEAVDLLIFDECAKAPEQIWEKYLRPTLTDRKGRAIFITTPEGTNWVYDLYKRGEESGEENEWESFRFPTQDNPHISKEDIEEARRTLKNDVFMQEYMADFFSFTGKIYKHFNVNVHVMDTSKIIRTGD